MEILICILKTIAGYFILMFVGTNLLGIVVRGILPTYKEKSEEPAKALDERSGGGIVVTIIFSLLSLAFLYVLYHYWNWGITLAGLILMLTRLPDLLFEMRIGRKISSKNIPKRPIDTICTILSWAAFPLIFYALCYIK
ncbi:hypothetical protein NF867_00610 [Solitalea sp. MAHUQ-68]|uniref:Uncharacterized protein n=1 Tax=Solitalea agri TaxID=2953739 RepID=A0A9X2F2W1_9SPHI|nr:hypothetical protein [Solitalea agri]MCO4291361.1 hypothetical protein [Solitalea agri]